MLQRQRATTAALSPPPPTTTSTVTMTPTCAVFLAALVASCLRGALPVKQEVMISQWSKTENETPTSGRLAGCLLSAPTTMRKRRITVSKVDVERDNEGAVLPWCGPLMSLIQNSSGCCGGEREEEEEEERKKDDFQRALHNEPQILTPHEPPEPQVIPNLSDLASEDCSSFSFFIYRLPVLHFS